MKSRYDEIAADLRAKIVEGHYDKSGSFPSCRELVRMYNTSQRTVNRATELLKQEKLIYSLNGIGTYVIKDAVNKLRTLVKEEV